MLYKNDTIDNASIGSFIRSARKMKGFTQESLAQALTIDSKYLSQVERGVSLPSYPLMVAISDTLKVSMEFLTRGVEGSGKSVDKETLFCIPEAKGLTEDEYQFIEKSMKDLIKNLKKRKSEHIARNEELSGSVNHRIVLVADNEETSAKLSGCFEAW